MGETAAAAVEVEVSIRWGRRWNNRKVEEATRRQKAEAKAEALAEAEVEVKGRRDACNCATCREKCLCVCATLSSLCCNNKKFFGAH